MKIRVAIAFVTLLVSRGPAATVAASFDCSKASSWVEKEICSDPELSDADKALDQKYREVLERTKEKEILVKSQRSWLKKRNSVSDNFMLMGLYKDRMIELDPAVIPMNTLTSTCPGFIERNKITGILDCRVSESGAMGSVSGRAYYYSTFCIIPDYAMPPDNKCDKKSPHSQAKAGVSIFYTEGTSNKLKLFMDRGSSDIGGDIYDRPEIVTHSFGTLLYVPSKLEGTGHYNRSEYYLWESKAGEWKLIDSKSWLKEAMKKIPSGDFGHGIWPNVTTMTAEVYIRKKDDPYCCASGGVAVVSLTVKNGKFVIRSIKTKAE